MLLILDYANGYVRKTPDGGQTDEEYGAEIESEDTGNFSEREIQTQGPSASSNPMKRKDVEPLEAVAALPSGSIFSKKRG